MECEVVEIGVDERAIDVCVVVCSGDWKRREELRVLKWLLAPHWAGLRLVSR